MKFLSDQMSTEKGFSLMEALVIVVIVAVVGGLGFFAYSRHDQAHASSTVIYPVSDSNFPYTLPRLTGCKTLISSKTQVRTTMTRPSGSPLISYGFTVDYTDGTQSRFSSTQTWYSNTNSTTFTTLAKHVSGVQVRLNTATYSGYIYGYFSTNSAYDPYDQLMATCPSL